MMSANFELERAQPCAALSSEPAGCDLGSPHAAAVGRFSGVKESIDNEVGTGNAISSSDRLYLGPFRVVSYYFVVSVQKLI